MGYMIRTTQGGRLVWSTCYWNKYFMESQIEKGFIYKSKASAKKALNNISYKFFVPLEIVQVINDPVYGITVVDN